MFDGSSFEMPSMPVSEQAPAPKEGLGVTSEQMEEIADFFEKQMENPNSKLIPLMADAEQNGAWDILALEVNKGKGMNFSPEQLEAAMKGGDLFKRASEMAFESPEEEEEPTPIEEEKEEQESETEETEEEEGEEAEDVDLSELDEIDKAA